MSRYEGHAAAKPLRPPGTCLVLATQGMTMFRRTAVWCMRSKFRSKIHSSEGPSLHSNACRPSFWTRLPENATVGLLSAHITAAQQVREDLGEPSTTIKLVGGNDQAPHTKAESRESYSSRSALSHQLLSNANMQTLQFRVPCLLHVR